MSRLDTAAGEYVLNGLDDAVRMPRKSGDVVRGTFTAEIVEQQERIVVADTNGQIVNFSLLLADP